MTLDSRVRTKKHFCFITVRLGLSLSLAAFKAYYYLRMNPVKPLVAASYRVRRPSCELEKVWQEKGGREDDEH